MAAVHWIADRRATNGARQNAQILTAGFIAASCSKSGSWRYDGGSKAGSRF